MFLLAQLSLCQEKTVVSDTKLVVQVDMLVGDIYGDRDYSNIGLSATTIASSFGKVVSEGKDLEDIDPADIALALCRCS